MSMDSTEGPLYQSFTKHRNHIQITDAIEM